MFPVQGGAGCSTEEVGSAPGRDRYWIGCIVSTVVVSVSVLLDVCCIVPNFLKLQQLLVSDLFCGLFHCSNTKKADLSRLAK